MPEKVLTNTCLEKLVDTTDDWIRQRTGIHQRHIAADDEASSDLGTHAARRAIENAGIEPDEIDYIICATMTPDSNMPATACLIQHAIGAGYATAVDVNAACSGFLYGLEIADALIRAGTHKTILVVGAEVLTSLLDWAKRDTAVIFGDGAGAVVVRAEEGDKGVLTMFSGANGAHADLLHVPAGGSREPVTEENIREANQNIVMSGQELYRRAVFAFELAITTVLERTNMTAEDIDIFIPHQANARIIDSAAKRIGMPSEKVLINLDKVGNTSAASIPIALDQAVTNGRIKDGSMVLFAAFGGGLTWASALVRW